MSASPAFDALLLLSFGGPEGPDDVRPFLENVTRGRNVPAQRLDEVAGHYQHFGGSPLNRLNREIIEAVRGALTRAGMRLPVYFGNRNWHPMVEDTVARMATDGVRRALVFATSAWGGHSGNDQYDEDIVRARRTPDAPELVKLRQFYDHPLFVAANADAVRAAYRELGERSQPPRLVFTAHSIPLAADQQPGADGMPRWYSRQVAEAARLVAEAVGVDEHDVVWQSRSGPAHVAWLEPDIVDHLGDLAARDVGAVVVSPIGFVSDHVEVLWDLDHEAREKAAELGIAFARAATAGPDPRFAEMIVELVREHTEGLPIRKLSPLPAAGRSINGRPVPTESYTGSSR